MGDGAKPLQSGAMRVTLHNRQQGHTAMIAVWEAAKEGIQAGKKLVLSLTEETRSNEQNAILHAVLTDIANQIDWHGKKLNPDIWKRLCVASWLREKNQSPVLIPALDGSGFDVVYEKTSKLTVTQCSELLEWCFAFGAEHGVKFRAMEKDI